MIAVKNSKASASFPSPFPPDVSYVWGEEGMPLPPLPPVEQAVLGGNASEKRVHDFSMGRSCARAALEKLAEKGRGSALGLQARALGLQARALGLQPRALELQARGPGPLASDTRPEAGVEEREIVMAIGRAKGRAPQWPPGIVGAITHTGGYAAAAVGRSTNYFGIGLDLERLRRGVPKLARRILRPDEQALLSEQMETERDAYITTVFSAKESIFKALNPATGIYLGFQDAAVELFPLRNQSPGNSEDGEFAWTLQKDCGSAIRKGFTGEGRYSRRDNLVLTAVWVTLQEID
jgi:4'-phosphopantetheinyl transferase EntD